LNTSWIDRIFARLSVRYGSAWFALWAKIPSMDIVKEDWASQLAGFDAEAIKHALSNLPEHPPNVETFKKLCRIYRPLSDLKQIGWKPGDLHPEVKSKIGDFMAAQKRKAMVAGMNVKEDKAEGAA
jgi:hypothetical protein